MEKIITNNKKVRMLVFLAVLLVIACGFRIYSVMQYSKAENAMKERKKKA